MTGYYMLQQQNRQPLRSTLVGRTFINPFFDYLLIGGGLSLVVVIIILLDPKGTEFISTGTLPYFFLLSNSAHFAASTVRLYTKPGTYQSLPFVTMALPLVTITILTVCMFQAGTWGSQLTSLYLTWSPFHYAAQAYGLAVMYCYRSGCLLSAANKKLLWWVSMLPFIYNFVVSANVGLHWIDVGGWLYHPSALMALHWFQIAMPLVASGAIVYLFWRVWRSESRSMPLISILILITNGVWWFLLPPLQAFVWATIFHGIQYLAIVIIFHVKDQLARPNNRHSARYHTFWFYGVCLLLGYGLFHCFPRAFIFAGFGPVESVLLVVAVINIHHFIVDAYIWRLKKTDNNRKILGSAVTASA